MSLRPAAAPIIIPARNEIRHEGKTLPSLFVIGFWMGWTVSKSPARINMLIMLSPMAVPVSDMLAAPVKPVMAAAALRKYLVRAGNSGAARKAIL